MTARTTAMMPMVRYWRERKASAPSRMAFGDGLHVLGARVPGDDRAGDEESDEEREDADGEGDPKPDGVTAGDRGGGWGIVLKGEKQSRRCAEMHEQVSS